MLGCGWFLHLQLQSPQPRACGQEPGVCRFTAIPRIVGIILFTQRKPETVWGRSGQGNSGGGAELGELQPAGVSQGEPLGAWQSHTWDSGFLTSVSGCQPAQARDAGWPCGVISWLGDGQLAPRAQCIGKH